MMIRIRCLRGHRGGQTTISLSCFSPSFRYLPLSSIPYDLSCIEQSSNCRTPLRLSRTIMNSSRDTESRGYSYSHSTTSRVMNSRSTSQISISPVSTPHSTNLHSVSPSSSSSFAPSSSYSVSVRPDPDVSPSISTPIPLSLSSSEPTSTGIGTARGGITIAQSKRFASLIQRCQHSDHVRLLLNQAYAIEMKTSADNSPPNRSNDNADTTESSGSLPPPLPPPNKSILPISQWNAIHCAALITRLYKLPSPPPPSHQSRSQSQSLQQQLLHSKSFQFFLQHLVHIQSQMQARQIANIIYSLATFKSALFSNPLAMQVIIELSLRFIHPSVLSLATPEAVSIIAWSHHSLDMRMEEFPHVKVLFDALALNVIESDFLSQCEPRSISALAVAFAGRGYVHKHLFAVICRYVLDQQKQLHKWEKQALGNLLHSCATLLVGVRDENDSNSNSKNSSDTILNNQSNPLPRPIPSEPIDYQRVYNLLIEECSSRLVRGLFDSRDIATVSWSLGKLSPPLQLNHATWFETLLPLLLNDASESSSSSSSFSFSSFSSSSFSFPLSSISPSSLLSSFKPSECAGLIWSLAALYEAFPLHHPFYSLLHRVLHSVGDLVLLSQSLDSRTLSTLALSYCTLRYLHRPFFTLTVRRVLHRSNELSGEDCSNLMSSYANFRVQSPLLYSTLCERFVKADADNKSPIRCMITMAWSLAVLNQLHLPKPAQLLTQLIDRLNAGESENRLKVPDLSRLHQLQLALLSESHSSSRSPSSFSSSVPSIPLFSSTLASRCRDVIENESVWSSNRQHHIGMYLTELGVVFQSEYVIPECAYRVDFMITHLPNSSQPCRIVFEYDGPYHYFADANPNLNPNSNPNPNPIQSAHATRRTGDRNTSSSSRKRSSELSSNSVCVQYQFLGSHRFVTSHLMKFGYKVIRISHWEYNACDRDAKREMELIRNKLEL